MSHLATSLPKQYHRTPAVGGTGGKPFEVYSKTSTISLVQCGLPGTLKCTFWKDTPEWHANDHRAHTACELEQNEVIEKVFIGGPPDPFGEVFFIKFKTDKKEWSSDGKLDLNLTPNVSVPRSHLVGFYGRKGDRIDQLGAILELLPDEYVMKNVEYNIDDANILEPAPEFIGRVTFQRKPDSKKDAPAAASVVYSYNSTQSSNWTHSIGATVGVTTTVEAGIPLVSEGKVEVSAEASYSHTWGADVSRTVGVEATFTEELPPGVEEAYGQVVIKLLKIDVPYTATVLQRFGDGVEVVTEVAGVFKGVQVVDLQCTLEG